MANVIATNDSVSHEYYVLHINGRVSSIHRRYQDAVGAGLQLKHEFPRDDIKVSVRNSPDELDNILHWLGSRLISGGRDTSDRLRFPLPAPAEKIQKAGVKKREIIFRVTTALSMGLSKGLSCREDITANFNSAKINPDVVRTFVPGFAAAIDGEHWHVALMTLPMRPKVFAGVGWVIMACRCAKLSTCSCFRRCDFGMVGYGTAASLWWSQVNRGVQTFNQALLAEWLAQKAHRPIGECASAVFLARISGNYNYGRLISLRP